MKKPFLCCLLTLLLLVSFAQAEDTTLYVFGSSGAGDFDNDTLKQTNPHIHWTGVEVEGNNNAKDMALQMQTNNRCFDLYSIGYAYCGFVTLRDKGFCLDLSSYPELTELVGKMYPYLQKAAYADGKLYAVPIRVSVSGWAYNEGAFEAIGLGPDAVPRTYADLLKLIQWWTEEGYEKYPDYNLFLGADDSRSYLINQIISDYVNDCTLLGDPVDFKNQKVLSLFQTIDTLDTEELDQESADATSGMAYRGDKTLFVLNYNYSNLSDVDAKLYTPLHLCVDDRQLNFPADVQLFAINPQSPHIDEAVKYIAAFLQGMDAESKISLFSDASAAPIEDPNYQSDLADNDAQMALVQAAKNPEDPNVAEMKTQLENERMEIEDSRWVVSAEQITQYQAFTKQFCVREQNLLERNSTNGTLEILDQVNQYVQRAFTPEQFAKEANRVVQMVLAEENGE